MPESLQPRELAAYGERWRPYRTVASWYMWRAIEIYGKRRKVTKAPGRKKSGKGKKSRAKKTAKKTTQKIWKGAAQKAKPAQKRKKR